MRKFPIYIIAVLLVSCAVKAKYIAEPFAPPVHVALLPFSNQSNDLDAPDIARKFMLESLIQKGYDVKSLNETDEILKKIGISEGGHLGAFTPEKLVTELGVEGLFYGDVVEFNYINVGVYTNRVVELNIKLVDPKSGKALWEDEKKVSNKEFELDKDKIKEKFIIGLAKKTIEKIISKPLAPECQEAVKRISLTLPNAK